MMDFRFVLLSGLLMASSALAAEPARARRVRREPPPKPPVTIDIPKSVPDSRLSFRGHFQGGEGSFMSINVRKMEADGTPGLFVQWRNFKAINPDERGEFTIPVFYLDQGPGNYQVVVTGNYFGPGDASLESQETATVTNEDKRDLTGLIPPVGYWPREAYESWKARTEEVTRGARTKLEAAGKIHDWVSANVYYNHTKKQFTQLSESEHRGLQEWQLQVCTGYAETFEVMARMAGIRTITVRGSAGGTDTHFWNRILIDGRWLAVDTTWDSNNGLYPDRIVKAAPERTHFAPSEAEFVKTHTNEREMPD